MKKGFKHSEETRKKDRPENRMLLTVKEHTMIHLMQGDIKAYGGGRKRCKEEI